MIVYARAPLRLGFSGGGTDIEPYCSKHTGNVLNCAINKYAYCTLSENTDNDFHHVVSYDRNLEVKGPDIFKIEKEGTALVRGVYNYFKNNFKIREGFLKVTTFVDAPIGSGLGSSSTLTVSIVAAMASFFHVKLTNHEIAEVAFYVERIYLKFSGGKQDQFAASYGGLNFMTFHKDKTIVEKMVLEDKTKFTLEHSIVIFYSHKSRDSSTIIDSQIKNVKTSKNQILVAMHNMKKNAKLLKDAILKNDADMLGPILNDSWINKKQMSSKISNSNIDKIYRMMIDNGATGAKISGAGGGGYMLAYCPGNSKYNLIRKMGKKGYKVESITFDFQGVKTWRVD